MARSSDRPVLIERGARGVAAKLHAAFREVAQEMGHNDLDPRCFAELEPERQDLLVAVCQRLTDDEGLMAREQENVQREMDLKKVGAFTEEAINYFKRECSGYLLMRRVKQGDISITAACNNIRSTFRDKARRLGIMVGKPRAAKSADL